MNAISFFVPGDPKPQGSKDQFGRESCKLLPAWRSLVSLAAKQRMGDRPPSDGPIYLTIYFQFSRPKGHYGSGKNCGTLKDSAPNFKTSKPDIDKLMRAVLDAGTGILWKDDSQVFKAIVSKSFAHYPGAKIEVEFWEEKP